MLSHRSRIVHQTRKPQQLEHLDYDLDNNPQDLATSNLLRISYQQFDPLDYDLRASPLLEKTYPQKSTQLKPKPGPMRKSNSCNNYQTKKPRVSVIDHYTDSFNRSRRPSLQLSHQQHREDHSRNVLNTSNFLVLSHENYQNIKIMDSNSQQNRYHDKTTGKSKGCKNVGSLLRKRNKSLFKQYLQLHKDKQHQNQVLKKRASSPNRFKCEQATTAITDEPQSPIRIISPSKIEDDHNRPFKCANQLFRTQRAANAHIRKLSREGMRSKGK